MLMMHLDWLCLMLDRTVEASWFQAMGDGQFELAARAGLSLPTVKRLEAGFGPRVSDEARIKLQRAIEAAGIAFIDENERGLGVRLRKTRRRK